MRESHYKVFRSIRNTVLLACVFTAASASQDTPSFRSNVELVALPCTVVDAQGAAVTDLKREEFRVSDNGFRRIVEHLWLDTDQPLTLGLLIDASESQHDQLTEHRQTALALMQRILRPGDHVFVISVDEEVRSWDDLKTGMPGELFGQPCPKHQFSVPGLRPISSCGASPLWNAVYDAARLKLRPLTGNKALLILTDGFDSGSTHTWRQAVDEVHRADATVYAIQYQSKFGGKYAAELYRLVADAGGAWFPAPAGDYRSIVSRIESDLRHRYFLGFRPEQLSGKIRHDVQVEVTRPDLSVRARNTYYRTP